MTNYRFVASSCSYEKPSETVPLTHQSKCAIASGGPITPTASPDSIAIRSQQSAVGVCDFRESGSNNRAGDPAGGNSHTANVNLFRPVAPRPFLLWIHPAVFSGWVAFFILQSTLVRTHNVRWHRSLGWFGAALGTVMVPLGITTAIVMGRFDTYRMHQTGADAFLIVRFFDMAAFATCLALAIYWRRKAGELT